MGMDISTSKSETVELRSRAGERLSHRGAGVHPSEDAEGGRLLKELQVHTLEVEMQNQELRETRETLEELNNSLEERIARAWSSCARRTRCWFCRTASPSWAR
jgi:hypothetical protein